MKILELFAGSCSFSNVAKELGYKTFTTDIKQFGSIDYVVDIMDFDFQKVPFIPDIIWASPPCTTFSVASIGTHWTKGYKPKTEEAKRSISIIEKTQSIILLFTNALKSDKQVLHYIENPRGMLRKLRILYIGSWRKEVCYCKYGDKRMKPTDIWTNDFNWVPKPMCKNYRYDKNGNIINRLCHHESAPRGSRAGTQGLKNSYDRSKVPRDLCLEILTNYEVLK